MNDIKLKPTGKEKTIKAFERTVNIGRRIKGTLPGVNGPAEETAHSHDDNPQEYAVGYVADAAGGTAKKVSRFSGRRGKQMLRYMGTHHSQKLKIKTAKVTAETAVKAAPTSIKAAEQTVRAAAKTAVQAMKTVANSTVSMVKGIIAAGNALISTIAAGGSVAVSIIVIICLAGLVLSSPFGIFFSGQESSTGAPTMSEIVARLIHEFEGELARIQADNPHDTLVLTGSMAEWKEVLAVYALRTATNGENGMDVVILDDLRIGNLREVFWDMNSIEYRMEEVEQTSTTTDEEGNTITDTWDEHILHITLFPRTAEEQAAAYGFSGNQMEQLEVLLREEYDALFQAVTGG